ncbi:orotidine-5'-phosphate decarboxylase [Spirochaetia bacterium 38H-sp]|uniref:Orotate phosphoribosyltransferase n=1 Tax=Rarispira pelagica TaxID=3141764 RepID=A0ABU9UD55_9SPIR
MSFFDRLSELSDKKDSLLCVGLDPRLSCEEESDVYSAIINKNKRVIEATVDYSIAYKPNSAFYEAYGPEGMRALEDTVKLIQDSGALCVLDVKRGDIGSTSEAYAAACYRWLNADAVTLNPYMGKDAVSPFLSHEGKGVFVLCRTSNPSACELEEKFLIGGQPVFERVAELAAEWGSNVGLVVGGNMPDVLVSLRQKYPDVWFLAPGVGAQGGSAYDAVLSGARADGKGVLVVVARAIYNAEDPAKAAADITEDIRRARRDIAKADKTSGQDYLKQKVLRGLIDANCFKVGDFVLKSGKRSPFYVDLRRVPSFPSLFENVVLAYAALAEGLDFDCIAGIPTAGLPFGAALAYALRKPLIYPRLSVKDHGTKSKIEGEYEAGQKVLLVDDLITTGGAKIEAAEILREAGLLVSDLVVLLERGAEGRKEMENAGIKLNAFAHIREFLPMCRDMGLIEEKDMQKMLDFAEGRA